MIPYPPAYIEVTIDSGARGETKAQLVVAHIIAWRREGLGRDACTIVMGNGGIFNVRDTYEQICLRLGAGFQDRESEFDGDGRRVGEGKL